MQYVTSIERKSSDLRRLLTRRFGRLPDRVEERLKRASRDELERWLKRASDAKAVEDIFS